MAIALVQAVAGGPDSSTPIVLVPTPGNLLVSVALKRDADTGQVLIGFTPVAPNPQVTPNDSLRVAWRIAQVGDAGSWVYAPGGSSNPMFLAEFSGVDRGAPVDVAAGAGSIPTQLVSVSLSPTAGSRLVIAGIEISDNGTGNLDTNITPGAGYLLTLPIAGSPAGHPLGAMIHRILPAATGADVAPNATGSGGLPNGNAIIAVSFKAAGAGGFAGEPGGGVW